ncbi:hypothetical protein A1O3_08072 [Capronia epimyces CBS 606.96]|uniref:Extracellular membrane protein CFEM domain-containing protein n=1 Tax=Capronia epimyces CBS 606.96 TaxID=1182542 RepID=W9XHS7_9EURO|nr:uncharacterized protein A1O3_08072 [Capronia epimyces CBS 606.96]EXJ79788.1 hypothetical protein A1O3_08072 [Capronia epimyces CBS 606.96]
MIARLPAVILVLYRTFQLSDASFNFSPYLVCAQTYLYSNAPAECDYGDTSVESTTEEDICLCSSASFLDGVARDVWQNCGCEALTNTANQIVNVCMEYNVDPLIFNVLIVPFYIYRASNGTSIAALQHFSLHPFN